MEAGAWIWKNKTAWEQLHPFSTHSMTTADIDGNGQADLVVDFGDQYGVWIWRNHATWTQLSPWSP